MTSSTRRVTHTRARSSLGPHRERWYDIVPYKGAYQVSSLGHVRALARFDATGNRRSAQMLRPNRVSSGRLYVSLCKRGVSTCYCVSALLARAYRIANPRRCGYVIHRDGNNRNFRRANLAWATIAQQRMHDGRKTSCPYYGVTWNGERPGTLRWVAVLRVDKRRRELGQFATPQEAAYAYDCEVKRLNLARPLNRIKRRKSTLGVLPSSPGEIWRPFPGAERTHQISNRARVRTLLYRAADGRRVLPKLRRISVTANGCRTILIAERRYGIARVMAHVFPGGRRENLGAARASRRGIAAGAAAGWVNKKRGRSRVAGAVPP